jgi:hypothetical protein
MDKFLHQHLLAFDVGRINDDAFSNGADFLALGFIVVADTLGALVWVDFKNFSAHENGVIWALWLAHVAIGAGVANKQGH